MKRGVREGVGHSGYISPTRGGKHGISDMADRTSAAREGSARLLAAVLGYYERRRVA